MKALSLYVIVKTNGEYTFLPVIIEAFCIPKKKSTTLLQRLNNISKYF